MSKSIKNEQLGMNYSTASNRLVRDILFNFIVVCGQNKCFRCGEPMERHNFSIEHKVPWLHSEKPKETFFDLNNISFSHLSCNAELQVRVLADPPIPLRYDCNQRSKYSVRFPIDDND